jgi:hypothetical protein
MSAYKKRLSASACWVKNSKFKIMKRSMQQIELPSTANKRDEKLAYLLLDRQTDTPHFDNHPITVGPGCGRFPAEYYYLLFGTEAYLACRNL